MPYRQPLLVAQNERCEVRRAQLMRREDLPARDRARAVVSAVVSAVVKARALRRRREHRGRVLLVEAADAQERHRVVRRVGDEQVRELRVEARDGGVLGLAKIGRVEEAPYERHVHMLVRQRGAAA